MTLSSQGLVSFLLYFIFLTTIHIIDSFVQYLVLIGVTFIFTGMVCFRSTWPKLQFVDIFALIPLLTWLYGVSVGVLNSNNVVGIVRNFAGLLFYLAYFFMVFSRISQRRLITVIINASIVYLLLASMFGLNSYITRDIIQFSENGTSSLRLYYSPGLLVLIPALFIYMSRSSPLLKVDSERLSLVKKNVFIIIAMFLSLFVSGSKAIYLSLLALVAIFIFMSILYGIAKLRVRLFALMGLFSGLLFMFYVRVEISSAIDVLISLETDATHPRVIQAKELIDDFTVFGKGLGAVVPGYSRDVLGYGFELSFHNIIHKFGIISVFMFASFLAPIFYSVQKIIYKSSSLYSYLPLVFMLYLLPAWGNPTIFAPVSVILHCVALYLIRLNNPK
ncbi:hypothetical protein N9D09_00990 [bacterium]|nr:hypothetical protein [bacterium]